MSNNRELLAQEIVKRFVASISGTEIDTIVGYNPNDRIYVGKLSPQSASDTFSSSVLIKQIGVNFRVSKADMDNLELDVFPQGNFFFRIIPTYEQQKQAFLKDFLSTFTDQKISTFEDLITQKQSGGLSKEMLEHKVSLLPIYKKIAIDRKPVFLSLKISDIYNAQFDCGRLAPDSSFKKALHAIVDSLCSEVKAYSGVIPCQFRDRLTIDNLITADAWEKYKQKQIAREEFEMFSRFDFDISVDVKGVEDYLDITIALSNETAFGDETSDKKMRAAKADPYRINTLFNSGIKVKVHNGKLIPVELDYFADDYKYDKYVYALGYNCNVECVEDNTVIQTVHVPFFIQKRLKTNNSMAVKFDDLIRDPVSTLNSIYESMLNELSSWEADFASKNGLTPNGKRQFEHEINSFRLEIKRFKTGVELIDSYHMIRTAFKYMNQAFKRSAKGYDSWRLFQIVFVVSLILDITANEPELILDDEIKRKAKTDDVDILYFPTGGGKTEAFLGILIFNLFFDRLRGKECGVTAMLKYPLRLLSIQQVQRVSNILATAEQIRVEENLGGETFSLGYFVGEGNTPNKIDKELRKTLKELSTEEIDGKYRLLDVCPFCGSNTVHVVYDDEANSLLHICTNKACPSGGRLPLFLVDEDIYRYIPSVIISTVDKMTAIGLNMRFHNLLCGASYKCPKHGYTARTKCLADECSCSPSEFQRVRMKDPAPTLLIQDELHLIKESLGAYDSHYETLIEYFIRHLSGCNRGIKVIGATATISAYAEQARHLYWKNAIRFPAASPYLDHDFYSFIDKDDISRIIVGYAPFGKAIVNSVAYSLQYLKRVVYDLYQKPEQIFEIPGMDFEGSQEEKIAAALRLLEDYWIVLEYNNVKMESNRVLQALADPINTELIAEGIQPLIAKKMTGDDTFQEVRATLSSIEHTPSVIHKLDFNMIAATSMISHGVDADRFNLMLFYGMPGNTAEYIQAYSRVGRKHTGVVIDIMRPSREKDQSYLKNFVKFHEYKDILVDSVSINRWATKAVENTLPGVLSSLILNYYEYELQFTVGDVSKFGNLKKALTSGAITAEMLKNHAYQIYKCSDNDSSIGKLYRITIDRIIDNLVISLKNGSIEARTYLTEAFDRCYCHVMSSLRDTDKQIIVEMR
ncbi:hypothetical protein B5E65_10465 [Gemmiger sp. An120]|uniref:helicase-related protein n=1 Tax=Gemmiger sp. An120 TaxID=1965549 RepID=UPI000B3A254B|nr:helicase-related protein [Gemmiger sp. An120]OUQ41928.1 hypothetical protein B5E65_10465 [Gemmiger sp. An120]